MLALHTCTCTHTQTHTQTHTDTDTHTQTHTHTQHTHTHVICKNTKEIWIESNKSKPSMGKPYINNNNTC